MNSLAIGAVKNRSKGAMPGFPAIASAKCGPASCSSRIAAPVTTRLAVAERSGREAAKMR